MKEAVDSKKIKFYEEKDRLKFKYQEGGRSLIKVIGEVPDELTRKSKKQIKEHAVKEVKRLMKPVFARRKKIMKNENDPDFQIDLIYDDKVLKGGIISAINSTLKVKLEEPKEFQGTKEVRFNMFSAMSGHYIFNDEGNFSEVAIETSKNLLIQIYKEEKHKHEHADTIQLANNLND